MLPHHPKSAGHTSIDERGDVLEFAVGLGLLNFKVVVILILFLRI
jgi:hypothetical protein